MVRSYYHSLSPCRALGGAGSGPSRWHLHPSWCLIWSLSLILPLSAGSQEPACDMESSPFLLRTRMHSFRVIRSGGPTVTRLVSVSCWCFFKKPHLSYAEQKHMLMMGNYSAYSQMGHTV